VLEARALLAAAHRDGYDIGVAGYSMGANTAAVVSATVPFPVATTPMAASHSPSPVFLDGVLRHGIAFSALGGEDRADELRSVLGRVTVLDYAPQPHHAHAIIVGARSDAYIPAKATEDLAAHWEGSELRWLPGGHATLIWYRKQRLAAIIEETFERTHSAVVSPRSPVDD
jgi:dienelactone hydrolase